MLWTSKSPNNSHRAAGNEWELYAETYLSKQGLVPVAKNFHSRNGEIDLIMQDNGTVVFVEVKYRKNSQFGGAIAAVSSAKQQKLHKTAKFFLHQQGLNEGNNDQPTITWLKNAF